MFNIISLLSYTASLILLFGSNELRFRYLFLIPLTFGLMYGMNSFFKKNKFHYMVLAILFVTSFIRYVVTPFLMFFSGNESAAASYPISLFYKATFLQLYEEILFFFTLQFFAPKLYRKVNLSSDALNSKIKAGGNSIINGVILLAVIIVVFNPEFLSRYHFVPTLTGYEGSDINDSALSGTLSLIIQAARQFFVLSLLAYALKQYNKTKHSGWVYFSIVVIGVNSFFVNDLSRFGLLIPAATFVYLITQLFSSHRKPILIGALVFVGAAIIYTSYIKMFSDARGGFDKSQDFQYWGASLQMYFQGQSDIVIGLAASDEMVLPPILAFLNDVISNVAGLSHYSIEQFQSLYIFNVEYSGGMAFDKILPNVCAGYNYLGFIGAPLILVLITITGIWFDARSIESKDIYLKYIYIFGAITCSMPHMIYYTMTVSGLINSFIVMYLIIKFNNRISHR